MLAGCKVHWAVIILLPYPGCFFYKYPYRDPEDDAQPLLGHACQATSLPHPPAPPSRPGVCLCNIMKALAICYTS